MSFSNQDRLDMLKALFHLNGAVLSVIANLPPETKAGMNSAMGRCTEAQEAINSLMKRLDSDLDKAIADGS